MNGLHFYLWHYWDATAYVGCVFLLFGGIAAVWLCSKLVNVTWAARNGGAILSYALLAFLLPTGVLYFNAAAAQRIVDRGPRSLSQHMVTLRRDALIRQLTEIVEQKLPGKADAQSVNSVLFGSLCEYVRENSEKHKHALPLPQGINEKILPAGGDLQQFFYEVVYRNRRYSAQLDAAVDKDRAKQINDAINHYLCNAAWEQNEKELREAAEPMWGFFLLWGGAWLLWTMYQAFTDIKRIYPYRP